MNKNIVLNLCFLISFFIIGIAYAKADWTIAVYMEASSPDMHYWAYKNINDMAFATFDYKKVQVVTQVHLEKSTAWRYLIKDHGMQPVETVHLHGNGGQRFIDFMTWVGVHYPARHYVVIFSGHGFGILDPEYRPTTADSFLWDVDADEPGHECQDGVCPLKNVLCLTNQQKPSFVYRSHCNLPVMRGFMFDDTPSFIDNAMLLDALKTIKNDVLHGQLFDIIGTDCCKMAMLEFGYQVKDYARYVVGSQNCELKDGWNYKDFLDSFNGKDLDEVAVVEAIVKTYGSYYAENTIENTYSLSAIDLSKLDPLIANINDIVAVCKKLYSEDKQSFKDLVVAARSQSPSMCGASYYLDLGMIYTMMLDELNKRSLPRLNSEDIKHLKALLVQGQRLVTSAVVANVTGTAVARLQGISIYFPRNKIDPSYFTILFAQETRWLDFLNELVENS